jgi:D-alanine--D-alanine ligase
MKIALICGGPSPERGISLNSARSVLDHLESESIEIVPIYFDIKKNAYHISTGQLYSNTPSDFDFKLQRQARLLTERTLIKLLRSCDIVFSVIHGAFGEDGEIQSFFEKHQIPFIGSSSQACKKAFDKFKANEFIKSQGFFTLPSTVLKIYGTDHRQILEEFFAEHNVTRAVVKPATGGSSIGVFSVGSVDEALEKVQHLFSKRVDTRVVVEPFCTGTEFTVIILQNRFGLPVAILPTEIETDYQAHQIFDYRKKYLPTRQVTYHCPPRFGNETIEKIQYQAEQIFTALGMQDFARFDGWVMPDGNIWFSDFNPVSGMEQNSFLFQQGSRIGFSHGDLLRYITKQSCSRQGISFTTNAPLATEHKKPINILFGGSTSERQVSLMSGTNVWLKLRRSHKYEPTPHLLDQYGNVWKLPYALILNHTVEEIVDHAINAASEYERLKLLEERARLRLALEPGDASEVFFLPEKMTLDVFIKRSSYVFIALHGGIGENGTIQSMLEAVHVPHNGSDSRVSALCMDKWETNQRIQGLNLPNVTIAPQYRTAVAELSACGKSDIEKLWNQLQRDLAAKTIIAKPADDGCSSGIVRLYSAQELQQYVHYIKTNQPTIPAHTFKNQATPIEMPLEKNKYVLFEQFIETDMVRAVANDLKVTKKTGWVEVTVGVWGKKGAMSAMNPSLTVAEGGVLSLEEKFQGGTGVNITPPSKEIIAPSIVKKIQHSIENVANALGLTGYARIDAFVYRRTGEVKIIEVNTLPGLTPSTVIYHQALAEVPQVFPTEFLERIIDF